MAKSALSGTAPADDSGQIPLLHREAAISVALAALRAHSHLDIVARARCEASAVPHAPAPRTATDVVIEALRRL
jgi:hypothetical protein